VRFNALPIDVASMRAGRQADVPEVGRVRGPPKSVSRFRLAPSWLMTVYD
jgi:hypothetical protein